MKVERRTLEVGGEITTRLRNKVMESVYPENRSSDDWEEKKQGRRKKLGEG
jgi:hypothetical protein